MYAGKLRSHYQYKSTHHLSKQLSLLKIPLFEHLQTENTMLLETAIAQVLLHEFSLLSLMQTTTLQRILHIFELPCHIQGCDFQNLFTRVAASNLGKCVNLSFTLQSIDNNYTT